MAAAGRRGGTVRDMWRDLFEYCQRQHGPVHVGVAAALSGFSVASVRARAEREAWWRPYRDVVAPPGTPRSGGYWALAAVARARGGDPDAPKAAALTRWSAAAVYGVHRSWPSAVEVLVPFVREPTAENRYRPVRSRCFDDTRLRTIGELALPVVAPAALVRDLARIATAPRLTTLMIDLVQRRHLRLDDVRSDLLEHPRYPGRRKVLEALTRLEGAGRTDSTPELDVRERLVAEGIPLDVGQIEVLCRDGVTIHLDLGIAGIRFAIEVDSMLAHATRSQLRTDVRRSNQLARLPEDWRVLRMTVEDLDEGWDEFLALVRDVVTQQSRRHLGRDRP
ncbi:hypothetical protein [Egicoccus sp. AB-alg6-2]|uniref:hypothetical protein n=1 Tax=Egicoccus sp. AB-alg6-2 TaxID=3242692 RepID=UPI00359E2CD6